MWKATRSSILAHKLRLALTGLAIVLGVAFMAGTLVLTDTIKHTFNDLFAQTAIGKDVVVEGIQTYGSGRPGSGGLNGDRPDVPESLLAMIKAVPGVRDASGIVDGEITLIDPDGKAVTKKGPPVVGTGWETDKALEDLTVHTGHGPAAANQVTVDLGTANSQHIHLGDQVTIISNLAPRKFVVVGTTKFGDDDSLAGASVISFETPVAQQLFGRPGYFTEISVSDQPGTQVDDVLTSIGRIVPKGYEAITGSAAAQQQAQTVTQFVSYFNDFLIAFALIALFVGAFLIANTFSILMGQRTRELALLRAMGASRRQVTVSMLAEALVVGVVSSAIGLGLGIPLALGLEGLLRGFGFGPPASGLIILPRTVIVAMLAGTVITLVSSVGPSVRASRIPPVAAMRDDAVIQETSLRRRAIVGGVLLAIGLLNLASGLFAGVNNPLPLVGIGAALTFVGIATLAPFFAGGLARLIGTPFPAIRGITGRLGQENAVRNPRRTAATASALMVGLAVVACIATLGASANASLSTVIDKSLSSSYVISSNEGNFTPAAEALVRSTPGVIAVSANTEVTWHEGQARKTLAAIDPATGNQVFRIQMDTGSYAALARGEVLMDNAVAKSDHLAVGDVIQMGFTQTGIKPFTIGGTYETNQFLDNYLLSTSAAAAANGNPLQDEALFLKTTSVDSAQLARLTTALAAYPNLKIETGAQFTNDQKQMFTRILAVVYVLLALSILIAAFSVVNTMALSVIERTREIGLVRSIGMLRGQVRAMIRTEAMIVSLLGAVLGLILGVALGAAIVQAAESSGGLLTSTAIPYSTVIVVLILAALIGVLAAVFPARRAAKLDVLRAIHAA